MSQKKGSPKLSKAAPADTDARARLIYAVRQLAAQKGIDGTSTREIAQLAQCNVSLISYYFGGKEGLYKESFRSYADEAQNLAGQFMSFAASSPMNRESFKKMMEQLINYSCDLHVHHPEMQVLLFRELSSGMPQTQELFNKVFFQVVNELDALMNRAKKAKIIRSSLNTRAYLISIFQLVDSFFMMKRCDNEISRSLFEGKNGIHEFKKHILGIVLDGGLAPS